MIIKRIELSKIDYKLHCPYCNEGIFSYGDEVFEGSCDHLQFIYDDDSGNFFRSTGSIKNAYDKAYASADEEGLGFDTFVEQLTLNNTTDSISIHVFDDKSYYAVGMWFGFFLSA